MNNMMMNNNPLIPRSISSLIQSSIILRDHPHPLIHCFTKGRANCGTSWICNKCNSAFTYDIPSFYCTLCDYDLCKSCLEKYTIGEVLVYNYIIQNNNIIGNPINKLDWQLVFPCHNHFLTLIQKENNLITWACKSCSKYFNSNESFFYCSLCDYNLCQYCANKYPNVLNNFNSGEIKIIFDYEGNQQLMSFKYGTTLAEALNQYKNKYSSSFSLFGFVDFLYNNIPIPKNDSLKVEDYFNKNSINHVMVSFIIPVNG